MGVHKHWHSVFIYVLHSAPHVLESGLYLINFDTVILIVLCGLCRNWWMKYHSATRCHARNNEHIVSCFLQLRSCQPFNLKFNSNREKWQCVPVVFRFVNVLMFLGWYKYSRESSLKFHFVSVHCSKWDICWQELWKNIEWHKTLY